MKVKRQAVGRPNFNYPEKPKSRRASRKDERKEKKQKKNNFHMKRSAGKLLSALGIEDPGLDKEVQPGIAEKRKGSSDSLKCLKGEPAKKKKKDAAVKMKAPDSDEEDFSDAESPKKKKKKKAQKMPKDKYEAHLKEMERTRRKQLRDENKREEKVIKQLEKRLHLNKRKSKTLPQSYLDDGMDYILDICDPEKRETLAKEESAFFGGDSGSEAESDKEDQPKSKKDKKAAAKPKVAEESEDDEEALMSDGREDSEFADSDDEEVGSEKTGEEAEDFEADSDVEEDDLDQAVEEEDDGDGEAAVESDESPDGSAEEQLGTDDQDSDQDEPSEKKKPDVWEDIYGRTRDKEGNVITNPTASAGGKYVPPALRGKIEDGDSFNKQEKARLMRTLKGLLNRLSDANLQSIADQIETLYGSHSRSLVNGSIFELTFESLVSPVLSPERLIMVHCLLIAALHANVGPELGAKFLEESAERIQQGLASPDISAVENKTLENLLWILTSLYTYKVIGSSCIYSLLRILVERFTVKEVELILLTLRNVGFMLRKDDPLALKELIAVIQVKAAQSETMKEEPRVRFMLESLNAIKNNNMAKIKQHDPEQIEHFRKILRLATRKGSSVTTLNVTYDELLTSGNRGRWWLVGSAWTNAAKDEADKNAAKEPTVSEANVFSQKLLDLAAKMRMNTDVRRNIFCVLMSAEDYVEAFEQLLKVNLSSEQRKEIIYVIMECCIREKAFNPYYPTLALKFATYDRTYQMTLQFALWDKLKELHSIDAQQMANLAKFFCMVLSEKGLHISALKAVNFAEIDKTTVRFLKDMIIPLLVNTPELAVKEIFGRLLTQNKLKLFKEGLKLFLSHFVGREALKRPENEKAKLLQRIRIAEEAMYGSSVM